MANYHKDYAFLMDNHYSRQAEIAAEAINSLTFSSDLPIFTFVDAGSHTGKLTGLILDNLIRKYSIVKTYCIEPDQETFQALKSNLERDNASFYDIDFQSWLKNQVDVLINSANLILNSHTFYHYPEDSWLEIITKADQLLKLDGWQVIILDSETSSLNEMKPVLDDKIPHQRHDAFGRFLKGSDLEKYLLLQNIKYNKKELPSPIHINDDEDALDHVCHMLGFVMRYDPTDIKKYVTEEVKEFIARYRANGKIVFPRTQDFFILPKQFNYAK